MNNVDTLNKIIETLKDGEQGFRAAGEDVQKPELRSLFSDLCGQRASFASELQRLAAAYGDESPANGGSTAGALHRGWINLKSAVVKRNAHAILEECERGEDSAVSTYQEALRDGEISEDVRTTLSTQFEAVKAAHDQIRDLRDSTRDE